MTANVMKKQRTPEEEKALEKAKLEMMRAATDYKFGTINKEDITKINTYVVQGDGIYRVYKNNIGLFVVKLEDRKFPGLECQFKGNGVYLNVPKVPERIFWQIRSFFIDIMDKVNGAEAFAQVFYDTKKEEYLVNIPEQEVTGTTVKYTSDRNKYLEDPERFIFVYEIHSHNNMGAFWSSTDDADEKETRFYGVLGKLGTENFEEEHRFVVGDKRIAINRDHVFDDSGKYISKKEIDEMFKDENFTKDDLIAAFNKKRGEKHPEEWLDNIKTYTSRYSSTAFPSYSTTGHSHGNRALTSAAKIRAAKRPGRHGYPMDYRDYDDTGYYTDGDYADHYDLDDTASDYEKMMEKEQEYDETRENVEELIDFIQEAGAIDKTILFQEIADNIDSDDIVQLIEAITEIHGESCIIDSIGGRGVRHG